MVIDFDKFRSEVNGKKSRIFSGRARGADVRKKSDINNLFEKEGKINILIPEEIFSITPSFLEEFLLNIVEKYGKVKVLEKLEFSGSYNIDIPLHNAIDNILLTKNALA